MIEGRYAFDPNWLKEIWDGYITMFDGGNKGKYWIWTKEKIWNDNIDGWFVTANIGKLQYDDGYYMMLIPVVQRKKMIY